MTDGQHAMSETVLAIIAIAGLGVGGAHMLHKYTLLSARNWYLGCALSLGLLAVVLVLGAAPLIALVLGGLALSLWTGSGYARRREQLMRSRGGQARERELGRGMAWDRPGAGERDLKTRIGPDGEIIRKYVWPAKVPYVPMAAKESSGRVPLGEGRHILVLGGTGSGKTVSADRIALARVLSHRVPALVLDPKGDRRLAADLSSLANYMGRPFVLFDPFEEDSDRWDPLWSSNPGRTVARILSPLHDGEPYYADTLRIHLGVVADALQALGLWPASMPLFLDAVQAESFAAISKRVEEQGAPPHLVRRLKQQERFLSSPSGARDLQTGAQRLRVVGGESWRTALTPRDDGKAVQLPTALRAGAIVLWRTHVDDIPQEAEAITTLALADTIAAAAALRGATEWIVVVDEFGSVMQGNAARQALAMLSRARSAGGQAIVVTQSASDVPMATGNEALRESLTDNFSAYVVHRQTSSESREWVAKLMGTRELWQSTDRTGGAGGYADGTGSRRGVHEFIVRPDELKELGVGQAYVWAPSLSAPERLSVAIPPPLAARKAVSTEPAYCDAGPTDLDEYMAPAPIADEAADAPAAPRQMEQAFEPENRAESSPPRRLRVIDSDAGEEFSYGE